MEVHEGGRAFVVPDDESVFYNPEMELNRDLTVAVLRAAQQEFVGSTEPTYLDATAGIGIRGIRADRAGYNVTLSDVNPRAIEAIERNLDRTETEATVIAGDVRRHLYEHRYDVIDLDPFGSPIPFVDAVVNSTNDLLCVTATDTAPLCGAHLAAGKRRYGAVPANTSYHAEVGLRVLIGALTRRAASVDVAAQPILAHATRHYVRVYLAIDQGATPANETLDGLGFLLHCPECLTRWPRTGLAPSLPDRCPVCDGSVRRIGPIWLDSYVEETFREEVASRISDDLGEATAVKRLLTRLGEELETVGHFDHHDLCDRLEVPATPIEELLVGLRERGFAASRTHFGGTTFKTTAPVRVIEGEIDRRATSE